MEKRAAFKLFLALILVLSFQKLRSQDNSETRPEIFTLAAAGQSPAVRQLELAWRNLVHRRPHLADSIAAEVLEDALNSNDPNEKAYACYTAHQDPSTPPISRSLSTFFKAHYMS